MGQLTDLFKLAFTCRRRSFDGMSREFKSGSYTGSRQHRGVAKNFACELDFAAYGESVTGSGVDDEFGHFKIMDGRYSKKAPFSCEFRVSFSDSSRPIITFSGWRQSAGDLFGGMA